MILEGVNFNEQEVAKMSADEFESRHISILWQDRDEATRRKLLSKAYSLISKPSK